MRAVPRERYADDARPLTPGRPGARLRKPRRPGGAAEPGGLGVGEERGRGPVGRAWRPGQRVWALCGVIPTSDM